MKEHFQLLQSDTVERAGLGIRPGNVLVTVRDYNTLNHLKWALERIDTKEQDIVVMSARVSQFGAAAYDLSMEQIFSDYEQTCSPAPYRSPKASANTFRCWSFPRATSGRRLCRPRTIWSPPPWFQASRAR